MTRRWAVFLDRDGVINENEEHYVRTWDAFRFVPGSIDAIRRLTDAGLPVVVVTNQSAIGRGIVASEVVEEIHSRMCAAIEAAGGRVERVLYCPHHPDDSCGCRKPRPAMLLRAAEELDLDLSASYFVGDHVTDVQAALAAGCRPILVRTGRGREAASAVREMAVPIAGTLASAVDVILAESALGIDLLEPALPLDRGPRTPVGEPL